MDLPDWAQRALAHFKPQRAFRSEAPDPDRLRQWEAFSTRFTRRWGELAPENWKVPDDHPSYRHLRECYKYPPAEYVRQCILECAIESAWEMGANKAPSSVIDAVRELDRLNEMISEGAERLATLFRQRDQLREDFALSDSSPDAETTSPDAFRLPGLLELVFSKHRFRTASYCYKDGLNTLYDALSSSSRVAPTIADLLDEVSWRMPRAVTSGDAGDIAIMGSKTNRSEWSPWALRLVARLGDWAGNGLPDGFFLKCLTHDQLATLAMVSVEAPDGAYSAPQMRELIKRYRSRSAK